MHVEKIPFAETHSFSNFFLDYIEQKDSLKKFYSLFPKPENFKEQIKAKKQSYPTANRITLVNTLTAQYKNLIQKDTVRKNISLLSEPGTFTITTGHQLNIFTGPLYFIYKIATVINASKELKKQYPKNNFVPVYWMASEDHDYEEIKYFNLYGKKYIWETEQQGAVGRFHTNDFKNLLNEVPGEISVFKESYTKNKNLADAVRHYVHTLFGHEGLVVVDGDDREMKRMFTSVISDDLFLHSSKKEVDEATQQLQTLGYHTQVNAREINFFYLTDGLRNRLEKVGDHFQVVDTNIQFSKQEIEKMIQEEPEKFSPNVVLRPLYQEMILPNLAYVGGPAELVYWLQLKNVFQHFKTPFPVLMPRNFAVVMDQPTAKKFEKTNLEVKDLFVEKNQLFNQWVAKNTHHKLGLNNELESLTAILNSIKERATQIDSTLNQFVEAETKRATNGLEKIEKKMLRAEKRFHSDKLRQLEAVKDTLFPNGSLQERTDNFLNFYQEDPAFIQKILTALDPFDFRFNVVTYD